LRPAPAIRGFSEKGFKKKVTKWAWRGGRGAKVLMAEKKKGRTLLQQLSGPSLTLGAFIA
jgi:hypothetical protein